MLWTKIQGQSQFYQTGLHISATITQWNLRLTLQSLSQRLLESGFNMIATSADKNKFFQHLMSVALYLDHRQSINLTGDKFKLSEKSIYHSSSV